MGKSSEAKTIRKTLKSIRSFNFRIKLLTKEHKAQVTRNVTGKKINTSIEKVFDSVGQMNWQSFVRNRLPLLNLHKEILSALRSGKIAYTKAVVIAKVKDEQARASLLGIFGAVCGARNHCRISD